MNTSLRDVYEPTFKRHSGVFLAWGILLIILGILALFVAELTTLVSIVFLGCVILGGGLVIIIDTFTFWWRKWDGFFTHLIMGVLYFVVGFALIVNPVLGAISLTLLLGIFYIVVGVFRVSYSLTLRLARWEWNFISGFISVIIGILILVSWPALSLWIIGALVGIDLIFSGVAYIMSSTYTYSLPSKKRR